MTDRWHLQEPTPEEVDQTKRVERALCNEINLLAREGIPLPCILTGIAMTAADFLTCQAGIEAVAPWFERNAKLVRQMQAPN